MITLTQQHSSIHWAAFCPPGPSSALSEVCRVVFDGLHRRVCFWGQKRGPLRQRVVTVITEAEQKRESLS